MQSGIAEMTLQGPPIPIPNASGLHARPAASFVQMAKKFKSQVTLQKAELSVNGKSVVSVMGLETKQGDILCVLAKGEDAQDAVKVLSDWLLLGSGESQFKAVPAIALESAADDLKPQIDPAGPIPEGAFVGVIAVQGIALGQVYQFKRALLQVHENSDVDAQQEVASLQAALAKLRHELQTQSETHSSAGIALSTDTASDIMAAHLSLLDDNELVNEIVQIIQCGKSAAFACQSVYERHAQKLEVSQLAYLSSRSMDLRDIGRRLVSTVLGIAQIEMEIPPQSILIAHDLSPSEAVSFDRANISGIVTVQGGATSHVAILAKSFDIPFLCGVHPEVLNLLLGTPVILDTVQGWLVAHPSSAVLSETQARLGQLQSLQRRQLSDVKADAVTADGCRIDVVANIRNAQDAKHALELGAEGVGLLRSEFLFTDRVTPPTEAEQGGAYLAVAQAIGPHRPLVIRTLDVGGDKPLSYLPLPPENNPFLGVRGVRVSLLHPELFRSQLRAILKVAFETQLHIMFPMVSDLEELLQIKAILAEEQFQLKLNPSQVQVGVMIEVPSAALMVAHLAPEVDFFSIGTNDLTQYTLAMDRGHPQFGIRANPLHPAVLKMIEITCTGALKHGKWVGVCGGLAGEALAVPLLVGLGVRELSVDAPSIPSVKASVRLFSLPACQALAKEVLALSSTQAVIQHLEKFHSNSKSPMGKPHFA